MDIYQRKLSAQVEASTVQSGPVKPCPTWRELDGAIEDAESNPDMAIRVAAAKTLTRDTSWDVIDEPSTLEACAGILGDLGQAQKICDEHVRHQYMTPTTSVYHGSIPPPSISD
eukprot:8509985-Pyramimonas_sp.AAC.1